MTTPAAYPRERARYATPGVVRMPALCTSQPQDIKPSIPRSTIQALDSRVSWPITTRALELARTRSWPSARPIMNVLSEVNGNSPATPRMPSVPKSCRVFDAILVWGLVANVFSWDLFHGNRNPHWIWACYLNQRVGHIGMPDK